MQSGMCTEAANKQITRLNMFLNLPPRNAYAGTPTQNASAVPPPKQNGLHNHLNKKSFE